ncbi:MAG: nucleotidyltransferase domain-containing protein [Candidatus Methanomethylicia archaeon]
MLTSEEIMKKIIENMDKIKGFGVKRIGLFGSHVGKEQKVESDIDIVWDVVKNEIPILKAVFQGYY